MLQQTQVTTVIPYYRRFLQKFPTVRDLATAEESAVLAEWSGLGYYSRAKNLRRGAQAVVERWAGELPGSRDELLEVPGIGPYTAGAIASIAFDKPAPIVDGNVQRVFSRLYGFERPLTSKEAKVFFWDKAEQWVKAAESPRILNQALMELGATICIKGTPRCSSCPLQSVCVAEATGRQLELPVKKPQREKVDLWWMALIIESDGKLFLRQIPEGEWWSGLWDFPRLEASDPKALEREWKKQLRNWDGVRSAEALGLRLHTVTHHRLHVRPQLVKLESPSFDAPGRWFTPSERDQLPISSLARKVLSTHPGGL